MAKPEIWKSKSRRAGEFPWLAVIDHKGIVRSFQTWREAIDWTLRNV